MCGADARGLQAAARRCAVPSTTAAAVACVMRCAWESRRWSKPPPGAGEGKKNNVCRMARRPPALVRRLVTRRVSCGGRPRDRRADGKATCRRTFTPRYTLGEN